MLPNDTFAHTSGIFVTHHEHVQKMDTYRDVRAELGKSAKT